MFSTFFCIIAVMFCLAICLGFLKSDKFQKVLAGIVGFTALCTLAFIVAPNELGWSKVPEVGEGYERRLDAGTSYRLIASEKDGDSFVLLVQQVCTSEFRAPRVKTSVPPPQFFTLVQGSPVAIAEPVCKK